MIYNHLSVGDALKWMDKEVGIKAGWEKGSDKLLDTELEVLRIL